MKEQRNQIKEKWYAPWHIAMFPKKKQGVSYLCLFSIWMVWAMTTAMFLKKKQEVS